ncbi:gamma-glutamyl-gamma-aminobutyrate hydrolase family protein [Myxococcota bacterium]
MKSPTGNRISWLLVLLLALAAPVLAGEATTVLITHPRADELRNIKKLVDRGLLKVPNLHLVGVYHADEWENYEDARDFIAGQLESWMEMKEISCKLDVKSVYQENDCTPVFRDLFKSSSAVIFTGGPDIPPFLYGEKTLLTTVIEDPPRHMFEISFLFHLLGGSRNKRFKPFLDARPDYVVLGLCLGLQSINVAAGGTLIQDIPSEVYRIKSFEAGLKLPAAKTHRSYSRPLNPAIGVGNAVVHPVRFKGRSELVKALVPDGKPIKVLSLHHQGIEKLGRGLLVLAASLDGKVIEAIRHRKFPGVLGIQFHAEKDLMWEPDSIYLQKEDDLVPNYVAEWFQKDPRARKFIEAFWRLVGERITKSAGGNP